MNHIQANVFYLLLRAHDHVWTGMPDLPLDVRIAVSNTLRADWGRIPPDASVPAVLLEGKRLFEIGTKLLEA